MDLSKYTLNLKEGDQRSTRQKSTGDKNGIFILTKFIEVEREFTRDGAIKSRFEERCPHIAE